MVVICFVLVVCVFDVIDKDEQNNVGGNRLSFQPDLNSRTATCPI